MLGRAWKGLGWFLAGVAVALGFLLVPLEVSAERKKLDRAEAAIGQARRDLRALETEFEARASLAQLEQWNGDTLRLTAPVAGQFVHDAAALAAIDVRSPVAGQADVQMASLVVPSRPTGLASVQAPAPAVRLVAPADPLAPGAATPATPAAPAPGAGMAFASATIPAADKPRLRPAIQVGPAAPQRRPQAVALLDRKLLADSTLGDLLATPSGAGGAAR